jgi:hypothetical protein
MKFCLPRVIREKDRNEILDEQGVTGFSMLILF